MSKEKWAFCQGFGLALIAFVCLFSLGAESHLPVGVGIRSLVRIREIIWALVAGLALYIIGPLIPAMAGFLEQKTKSLSVQQVVEAHERLLPHLEKADKSRVVLAYLEQFCSKPHGGAQSSGSHPPIADESSSSKKIEEPRCRNT